MITSLSEYKILVNAELDKQFGELEQFAKSVDPLFEEMVLVTKRYVASGGKRFRPYLTYLAYKGAGGKDDEVILPIAASLELLHSFLLIHDDIIDQDFVRYGVKNVSGVYQEKFGALGQERARRYGDNMAILAGDVVHILSSRAVARAQVSAELKPKMLELMFEVTMRVAAGELVDMMTSMRLPDVSGTEDRVMNMYINKTATYTFELPVRMGYLVAQGDESFIETIQQYSNAVGSAYQITDDILGVFGKADETGKSVDSDIREGKQTFLYFKALKMLEGNELARFQEIYGNATAAESEIQEVRDLLEKNGVRKAVGELAEGQYEAAAAAFSRLACDPAAAAAFTAILTQLKTRTS